MSHSDQNIIFIFTPFKSLLVVYSLRVHFAIDFESASTSALSEQRSESAGQAVGIESTSVDRLASTREIYIYFTSGPLLTLLWRCIVRLISDSPFICWHTGGVSVQTAFSCSQLDERVAHRHPVTECLLPTLIQLDDPGRWADSLCHDSTFTAPGGTGI
jgi:hypothetical protein